MTDSMLQYPEKGVEDGNITFSTANDAVVLMLCADGKIYLNGKEIADDAEVYAGLKKWLAIALEEQEKK